MLLPVYEVRSAFHSCSIIQFCRRFVWCVTFSRLFSSCFMGDSMKFSGTGLSQKNLRGQSQEKANATLSTDFACNFMNSDMS